MSRQIVMGSPQSRKLLQSNTSHNSSFAEVAGGTTAECAAIACCCPCVVANMLVLMIYKLPKGLCRKALRMKQRRQKLLKEEGLLLPAKKRSNSTASGCRCGCDKMLELELHQFISSCADFSSEESERAVADLEKEMWDMFYSTGFWRSPSQRNST